MNILLSTTIIIDNLKHHRRKNWKNKGYEEGFSLLAPSPSAYAIDIICIIYHKNYDVYVNITWGREVQTEY